jgi:hypothetical protein
MILKKKKEKMNESIQCVGMHDGLRARIPTMSRAESYSLCICLCIVIFFAMWIWNFLGEEERFIRESCEKYCKHKKNPGLCMKVYAKSVFGDYNYLLAEEVGWDQNL